MVLLAVFRDGAGRHHPHRHAPRRRPRYEARARVSQGWRCSDPWDRQARRAAAKSRRREIRSSCNAKDFARCPGSAEMHLRCYGKKPERRAWGNAHLIFIGTWRQPALARAAVVFAPIRKIALALISGDWTRERRFDGGLGPRKEPWILPERFSQSRFRIGLWSSQ